MVEEQVDTNANCANGTGSDPNGAGRHPDVSAGQASGAGGGSQAADAVSNKLEPTNVSRSTRVCVHMCVAVVNECRV